VILEFHEFIREHGASERHQNNNLKSILSFSQFLDSKSLIEIDKRVYFGILTVKDKGQRLRSRPKVDTTYNNYLNRLKHFFRRLYNRSRNLSMADGLQLKLVFHNKNSLNLYKDILHSIII
jgi:hypothetical protein